jgi:hypothetical protein
MMARSSKAPSMGRIQKRKTNFLQIIIFALQRAAGPYIWATSGSRQVYSITSSASDGVNAESSVAGVRPLTSDLRSRNGNSK